MSAARVLINGLALAQPMGGVRRHATEIFPRAAAILKERGGSLSMLTPRSGLGFRLPGVELIRSSIGSSRVQRILGQKQALEGAIQSLGPIDLVHGGHLPSAGPKGLPMVHLQHDVRRQSSLLGRSWLKQAIQNAQAVITVSQATADEVARLATPRQLHVIHHGGDHLQRVKRSTPSKPFVLVPGHLEPRKNPLTAVRALAEDPRLPTMLFVGAVRGSMAQRMQTEAARLGVLDRVRYTGPIPDQELAELYATCSAVLLTSRLEGFGLPVLEALHAGARLAISDIPAHAEIAPTEVPRFTPGSQQDCATALSQALDQAPVMGQVRTWDDAAESLVGVWSSVCENRQAP
ncbi:MAG: glycosyltransferase family 1 protein [bacterium]